MSEPDHLNMLIKAAKDGIHANESMFERPDDDWQPVLIILGTEGPTADEGEDFQIATFGGQDQSHEGLALTMVGIDPAFLSADFAKDILAHEVIPEVIRSTGAVAVAMISSSWYVDATDPQVDIGVRPSENPHRKEAVFIDATTREDHYFAKADIVRSANLPPILDEWDENRRSLGDATLSAGRFPDAIRAALEAND